jgi:hypothetical protein
MVNYFDLIARNLDSKKVKIGHCAGVVEIPFSKEIMLLPARDLIDQHPSRTKTT